MKIFSFADSHFDPDYGTSLTALQNIVTRANNQNADLLLGGGDIFHQSLQTGSNPKQYMIRKESEIFDLFDDIKTELDKFNGAYGWRIVPGNHDHPYWTFNRYFEKDYVIEDIGGVLIALLNSGSSGSYWFGYVDAEQLQELKEALETHSTKIVLADLHHPLLEIGDAVEGQEATVNHHFCYHVCRNGVAVRDLLATHSRAKVVLSHHIFSASMTSGYYLDAQNINHCYAKHEIHFSDSTWLLDGRSYIININTVTGVVDVDYFDHSTQNVGDIVQVTV